MRKFTYLLEFLVVLTLFSCTSEPKENRYETGYSDGYAEGYNTACKIRATLVEGAWSDKEYSRGYYDGRPAGVAQCHQDRNQEDEY